VADFEAVAGAAAAKPAWKAAMERWPSDPRPHLALGNQAHAAGDEAAAVRHYREGLERAPADPVLGNNLASVLARLGCRREARAALAAARGGLAEDSPWRANLEATARDVEGAGRRTKACDALR
jgi:Flp pilus assembly protein TadD